MYYFLYQKNLKSGTKIETLIVQSVMYSPDAVLKTQFLYNPCHSLILILIVS